MQIQNQEVGSIITDQAKLNVGTGWPQDLLPKVQGMIDMSPDFHKKILTNVTAAVATGSSTILSAKANIRYFIYGYMASFVKDATCDTADQQFQVNLTQNGVVQALFSLPVLSLTAERAQINMSYSNMPIRCDVNTAITINSNTFTAGKYRRIVVLYYTEEYQP